MSTIGEVTEVVSGGTPRTSDPAFWSGDVVWVTPTEVVANNGKTVFSSSRTITEAGLSSSSAKLLPVDTVLLTSRATIGAVALAGVPLATNQGFASLICGDDVLPKFVMYWCQANKHQLIARAGGNTFLEISRKKVAQVPICVPPLPEQRRIVDLIGSVDGYINSLQTQIEATRAARWAVLLELLSNSGEDWQQTTLSEVIAHRPGKYLRKDEYEFGGPYSVYGSNSVMGSHTKPLYDGPLIVMAGIGAYAGAVRFSAEACWVNNNAFAIWGNKDVDVEWLFLWMQARLDLALIRRATAQPYVDKSVLLEHPISVPPPNEQRRIADLVGSIDEQVSSLESQVASTQRLRGGVLSELLSGERLLDESYDVKVSL